MAKRKATPNALERAAAARNCGEAIYGVRHQRPASLGAVAAVFGLPSTANVYREITRLEAATLLTTVLHKDMAYGAPIMTLKQACNLADEVVSVFDCNGARFFTNGDYGRPISNSNVGHGWTAATDATFDTGVLVLAPGACACLWFKDED